MQLIEPIYREVERCLCFLNFIPSQQHKVLVRRAYCATSILSLGTHLLVVCQTGTLGGKCRWQVRCGFVFSSGKEAGE